MSSVTLGIGPTRTLEIKAELRAQGLEANRDYEFALRRTESQMDWLAEFKFDRDRDLTMFILRYGNYIV